MSRPDGESEPSPTMKKLDGVCEGVADLIRLALVNKDAECAKGFAEALAILHRQAGTAFYWKKEAEDGIG